MRIKSIMSIILLYLLALLCMIACSSAGSSQGSKIETDDFTSKNETDQSSQSSESTDSPLENKMDFHSWKELKLLCDATQGDSNKFLETLKILDEQYCTQKKTHVSFQLVHDKARYKDTFSNIYERIKDKKIIEFSNDVYIRWIEIKKGSDKVYVAVYGNINFKDEIIHLSYFAERNYTDHIENLQGESKITLKGEGYSVDVWSFSGLVDNKQVHKVYITEDGDDYPRFYVLVNSSKIDQPPSEELIRLLSELHITTIEEILEDIDS